MAQSWPVTVPSAPLRGSFQIQQPWRPALVTDFDDGNSRARRSTSKNIARLAFQIVMSADEFEAFKAWARDTLVDGTLAFTMSVWTGSGYAIRTCTLVERTYQAQPTAVTAEIISLTLDVEDY